MQLIVSGSHLATDADLVLVRRELDLVHERLPIELLIEGGARGVDECARVWAIANNVERVRVPADWDKYTNRRAAGPIRNAEMLKRFPEARVLAFPKGKSPGTRDCIAQAIQLGRKPRVVELEP